MQKISLAADHAGFQLKDEIAAWLREKKFTVQDHGCFTADRVDYPDLAALVAADVRDGKADRGILVCGTGIGMALTANRFAGVRAAAIGEVYSASMSREHNDLNVLCLGSRSVGPGAALMIVETFLQTEFANGRHADRVKKIHQFDTQR